MEVCKRQGTATNIYKRWTEEKMRYEMGIVYTTMDRDILCAKDDGFQPADSSLKR